MPADFAQLFRFHGSEAGQQHDFRSLEIRVPEIAGQIGVKPDLTHPQGMRDIAAPDFRGHFTACVPTEEITEFFAADPGDAVIGKFFPGCRNHDVSRLLPCGNRLGGIIPEPAHDAGMEHAAPGGGITGTKLEHVSKGPVIVSCLPVVAAVISLDQRRLFRIADIQFRNNQFFVKPHGAGIRFESDGEKTLVAFTSICRQGNQEIAERILNEFRQIGPSPSVKAAAGQCHGIVIPADEQSRSAFFDRGAESFFHFHALA